MDVRYVNGPIVGSLGRRRSKARGNLIRACDTVRTGVRIGSEAMASHGLKGIDDTLLRARDAVRESGDEPSNLAIMMAFVLDDAHADVVRAINDAGLAETCMDQVTAAARHLDEADAACAPVLEAERAHPHTEYYEPDYQGRVAPTKRDGETATRIAREALAEYMARHGDGSQGRPARSPADEPAPSLTPREIGDIEI